MKNWNTFFLAAGLVVIVTGCTKTEIPPAEKFVRSTLSADFRNLFYSANGSVICGEAGSNKTGKFKRFYSHWQERQIAYEGSDSYTFRKYVTACDVPMTESQLAAEETRQEAEAKSDQLRAQYQISREAREQWLEQNGDAIKSLHDAAEILQHR